MNKAIFYKLALPALVIMVFAVQGCDNAILDFTSTDDVLDKQPADLTEDSFFISEENFERAVFGAYAKVLDWYNFNQGGWYHKMYHLPGDDITSEGNYDLEIFNPITPATGEINSFWNDAYEAINRANVVLEQLDQEEDVYETPNLKAWHEGEVLLLRGIANFYIWNYFGAYAPLRTERITDSENIEPPSSNRDDPWSTELLDQAIADFQAAAERLPERWDEEYRGRATKNAAYGYAGKALVVRGSVTGNTQDFTDAITAFDNIQGAELVSNFGDNFSVYHQNNEESLFEVQSVQNVGFDNVWLGNDFNFSVGSQSVWWGHYEDNPNLFGSAPFRATEKLIDTFDGNDPRVNYSIALDDDNRFIKYAVETENTDSGVGSKNNPRPLRYADVMLLKAEAIVESGGDPSMAIALINDIRERARNSADPAAPVPADRDVNETDVEVIHEWIRDERFMELAGEDTHRWFDLRRWHRAGHINLETLDFSSRREERHNISIPKHLFFPIPQSERDVNSNVEQHQGY